MRWERGRYLVAVRRTRGITDGTRVLLLTMLDLADARGYVQVSRAQLAEELGRSERTITERVQEARAGHWLQVVERGRPPSTPATWALVIGREVKPPKGDPVPTLSRGAPSRPLKGRHLTTDEGGPRPDPWAAARSPESRDRRGTPGFHPDTQPHENGTGGRPARDTGRVPLLAAVGSDSRTSGGDRKGRAS